MSDLTAVKNRIMSKVDLAQLIGSNVKLERRSGRLFGLCPFHDEKSGSFMVADDRYYCFGCKAKGDAIDYIRQTHGLGFIEALKYLAQKTGVMAPELEKNKEWRGERRKQAVDYKALSSAQKWFQAKLHSPAGIQTRDYLVKRGFTEEQIREYGFGFAPDDYHEFTNAMASEGFSMEALVETSLARTSQRSGRPYAFFRNRLMVPIHDNFGRVIAFGGRTMGDDPAKYVNSSETYIFDKSKTLFGLFQAKDSIRKKGFAIIVEGYMDVLRLRSVGIENAVACMGTALTTKQLSQISQFAAKTYLCFDGDASGRKANLSTVASALEVPRISVQVISLPDKEDPDSFVSQHGAEAFLALKDQAKDLLSFAIEAKLAEHKDLSRPHLIKTEFIPWLSRIHDSMQRAYLINRIAQLTGFTAQQIESELRSQSGGAQRQAPPRIQPREQTRPLNSFQFELIGHIYFARSGEIDLDFIKQKILKDCEFGDTWQLLIEDMIRSLSKGQAPFETAKSEWESATDDTILTTLRRYEQTVDAFLNTDHNAAIQRILTDQDDLKRKQTVQHLTRQLAGASLDEQTQILKAIQELKRPSEAAQRPEAPKDEEVPF